MLPLLILAGCIRTPPVARVEITKWPEKITVEAEPSECYLDDLPVMPDMPDMPTWPTSEEDYYRRQYVHRRDFEELHQVTSDMRLVLGQLTECVKALKRERQP